VMSVIAGMSREIPTLKRYRFAEKNLLILKMVVSRTGYTGEDGLELVVAAADAGSVWESILAAGESRGVRPCGLGARDTLRLEAGMPLYGHELAADSDPFAVGLGFAVNLTADEGRPRNFPGAESLRRLRAVPSPRVRVGLALDGKRAAREAAAVTAPGSPEAVLGVVTSGSFCPTVGTAVAMANLDAAASAAGTPVDVLIRDAAIPARVVPLPFYRRPAPRT